MLGVPTAALLGPPECDRCGQRPRVDAHYGMCCECIVPFDNECHPEGTDQVYAKGYAAGYADASNPKGAAVRKTDAWRAANPKDGEA